jgi:hypothetical protein
VAPLVLLALPAVVGATTSNVPHRLVDGSTPPPVPRVLQVQDRTLVMTRVRVTTVQRVRRLVGACGGGDSASRSAIVVERIGVDGRTITFTLPGHTVVGCDRNPKARPIHNPWCGESGWTLRNGRVSDARLDICVDQKGHYVMAFGWINAVPRARWIVVDRRGFREVYPVAGRLPVRVSTVPAFGRPTIFRTAQYDGHGVLLTRRVVKASIAS